MKRRQLSTNSSWTQKKLNRDGVQRVQLRFYQKRKGRKKGAEVLEGGALTLQGPTKEVSGRGI